MGSAKVARLRLRRIGLEEWKERLDMLLCVAGYRLGNFPEIPWDRYYNADMSPGETADILIRRCGWVRNSDRVGNG